MSVTLSMSDLTAQHEALLACCFVFNHGEVEVIFSLDKAIGHCFIASPLAVIVKIGLA
jgi:hypothetical protein